MPTTLSDGTIASLINLLETLSRLKQRNLPSTWTPKHLDALKHSLADASHNLPKESRGA